MNDRKRGSTQHRIFQCVILIIVGVFCYLIISFLSIEMFHKRSVTQEHIFEMNKAKYQTLLDMETSYEPIECIVILFYMKHISTNTPCVIKKNEPQLEGIFEHISQMIRSNDYDLSRIINDIKPEFETMKMLQYLNATLIKGNINLGSLENKHLLLLQLEKEASYILTPIFNLHNLDVYKSNTSNETLSEENFSTIVSRTNLFEFPNKRHLVNFDLEQGDILYVPAYFFVQSKSEGITIKYQYYSTSRSLDIALKVLFDDTILNDI